MQLLDQKEKEGSQRRREHVSTSCRCAKGDVNEDEAEEVIQRINSEEEEFK